MADNAPRVDPNPSTSTDSPGRDIQAVVARVEAGRRGYDAPKEWILNPSQSARRALNNLN